MAQYAKFEEGEHLWIPKATRNHVEPGEGYAIGKQRLCNASWDLGVKGNAPFPSTQAILQVL